MDRIVRGIYEDNAGGLHLIQYNNRDEQAGKILTHCEYADDIKGVMFLTMDEDDLNWDELTPEELEVMSREIIRDDILIAEIDTSYRIVIYVDLCGASGRNCFGIITD